MEAEINGLWQTLWDTGSQWGLPQFLGDREGRMGTWPVPCRGIIPVAQWALSHAGGRSQRRGTDIQQLLMGSVQGIWGLVWAGQGRIRGMWPSTGILSMSTEQWSWETPSATVHQNLVPAVVSLHSISLNYNLRKTGSGCRLIKDGVSSLRTKNFCVCNSLLYPNT